MNERIKTQIRLEKDQYRSSRARVWIDIWVDQTKLSSMVIYSGFTPVAEDIVSGDLIFDGEGNLVKSQVLHRGLPKNSGEDDKTQEAEARVNNHEVPDSFLTRWRRDHGV